MTGHPAIKSRFNLEGLKPEREYSRHLASKLDVQP